MDYNANSVVDTLDPFEHGRLSVEFIVVAFDSFLTRVRDGYRAGDRTGDLALLKQVSITFNPGETRVWG